MNEEIIGHKATWSSVAIPLTGHQSESSDIGSYSSGRVESATDLLQAPKKLRLPIGPHYVSITCWQNTDSDLL
jgi:hypothetical protein